MSGSFKSGMIAALLGCCLIWTPARARTLVWVTDDTPGGLYIIGGGPRLREKMPGIEIDLYRMVAKKLGLTVQFRRLPWNQCLFLIGQNKVDGIFPASFKPERRNIGAFPMAEGAVDPSRMTRNNAYYLYRLNTGPDLWNGTVLIPPGTAAIGVPQGWAIVDVARELFGTVREETLDPEVPNLLIHRRLDGFICLETVFDAYLAKAPAAYAAIVKSHPAVWEKPYYLMLSRKFAASSPELAQAIWDAIREIRQSQAFLTLVARYVNTPGR